MKIHLFTFRLPSYWGPYKSVTKRGGSHSSKAIDVTIILKKLLSSWVLCKLCLPEFCTFGTLKLFLDTSFDRTPRCFPKLQVRSHVQRGHVLAYFKDCCRGYLTKWGSHLSLYFLMLALDQYYAIRDQDCYSTVMLLSLHFQDRRSFGNIIHALWLTLLNTELVFATYTVLEDFCTTY